MIQQVIAIASGKGGVGKSTIAVNLAFSLKQLGYQVGLLDADLYGPSLPCLLKVHNDTHIQYDDQKNMLPIVVYGIPTMSIGYLIDEKDPAIWRGPMASKAIQQLFYQTSWGPLDYLIIDLPPGTSDIHLTLVQKLPLKGVLMVTTPQQLALIDVRKAIHMFQKLSVALLGIIENMSTYHCQQCHATGYLFGQGGGALLAKDYKTHLLGDLPIDPQIAEQSDQGLPIVIAQANGAISQRYTLIAKQLIRQLQTIKSPPFPEIVVER